MQNNQSIKMYKRVFGNSNNGQIMLGYEGQTSDVQIKMYRVGSFNQSSGLYTYAVELFVYSDMAVINSFWGPYDSVVKFLEESFNTQFEFQQLEGVKFNV